MGGRARKMRQVSVISATKLTKNELPPTIPIIVDSPRQDPQLGFGSYVRALSAAVVGGNPARYTVGLYGPWGTGKSSILSALKIELGEAFPDSTVVEFDAWRHERAGNLLAPLLWAVKNEFDKKQTAQAKASTKKSAKEVAARIGSLLGGFELGLFGVVNFRIPTATEVGHDGSPSTSASPVDNYMQMYAKLLEVGNALQGAERVVVLIDDLDRCSPERVVQVIEAIRLLMDIDGFVFVLAIDYDVLIDAVSEKYPHVDAHRFIEKIIQVPFRIPNIKIADDLLPSIVPNWAAIKEVWFDGVGDDLIQRLIRRALRSNPRQVKRMLNSYMLARHISWDSGIAQDLLLISLGFQLRWPTEFERLGKELLGVDNSEAAVVKLGELATYRRIVGAAVLSPDDNVPLTDDSEELVELSQFVAEHLPGDLDTAELRTAMRMAADVSGPSHPIVNWSSTGIIAEGASLTDAARQRLAEALTGPSGLGFEVTEANGRTEFIHLDSHVYIDSSSSLARELKVSVRYPGSFSPSSAAAKSVLQKVGNRSWSFSFSAKDETDLGESLNKFLPVAHELVSFSNVGMS
jgi:hypothetical protein